MINTTKCRQLIICLLLIAVPTFGYYEEKVALEDSYTARIQSALDGLYGENKFLVRVDVGLSNPKYEVKHTKESNAKRAKKNEKKINILPGYPAIKNLNTEMFNQLPFDSVTTYIKPRITRVGVNIFADKSMSQSKIGKAKQMVNRILDVNKKLIKITVSTMSFYKETETPQDISIVKSKQNMIQNLFYFLILLALIALLLAFVFFQKKRLDLMTSEEFGTKGSDSDSGGSAGGAPMGGGAAGMMGGSAAGDISGDAQSEGSLTGSSIKHYFDFINNKTFSNFLSFIKREKMPIENVAVIASFLKPKLAAKLIKELELEDQSVVSLSMLDEKMVNRSSIEKLEAHVQNGLECLVGGSHKFQDTFTYIPGEIKQKLLGLLSKSNPEGFKLVRKNIIMFGDLKFLEAEEIQILLSEMDMNTVSVSLISAPDEVKTKFIESMTGSAKSMVTQFIEFRGKQYNKAAIESAHERMLAVVTRLENEGRFHLRDKIKA